MFSELDRQIIKIWCYTLVQAHGCRRLLSGALIIYLAVYYGQLWNLENAALATLYPPNYIRLYCGSVSS